MNNKSFTIIELLVVVAVIALISSIIVANISGTREEAGITSSLKFSQTINNTLGAYAVGVWSFDEGSDTSVNDHSGYGNNGTIYGATTYTSDTPHKVIAKGEGKYALEFHGVNDYIQINDSPSLDDMDEITIEAWVYGKQFAGDYRTVVNKRYCYLFTIDGTDNTLGAWGGNGSSWGARLITSTKGLKINKWHHIVFTSDANSSTLYIDGNLAGTGSGFAPTADNSDPVEIGYRNLESKQPFNGIIDEVRIYEHILSTAEIQKHYVEGAKKLCLISTSNKQRFTRQ